MATAIKALNGGIFVVLFSLVGTMAVPKRFAGVFSAAPSVALANLIVIVVAKGSHQAQIESSGMVVGAVAFVVVSFLGVELVRRSRARRGSAYICVLWLVLAEVGYLAVLR